MRSHKKNDVNSCQMRLLGGTSYILEHLYLHRHTWVHRHTMAPALQVDEELLGPLEGVHGAAVVHGRGPVVAQGQRVALQGHQLHQLLP